MDFAEIELHLIPDVHTLRASVLFNVDKSNVTPEMRRAAKIENFGRLYGARTSTFKELINIIKEEPMFKEISYNEDFGGGASVTLKVVESSKRAKIILAAGDAVLGMSIEDWEDLRDKTDALIMTAQKEGVIEGDLTNTMSLPIDDLRCPEYTDHKCGISGDACDDGYLPCDLFESVSDTTT